MCLSLKMRAVLSWVDKVHDRDKNEQCIYDLCFRPDGSQVRSLERRGGEGSVARLEMPNVKLVAN